MSTLVVVVCASPCADNKVALPVYYSVYNAQAMNLNLCNHISQLLDSPRATHQRIKLHGEYPPTKP